MVTTAKNFEDFICNLGKSILMVFSKTNLQFLPAFFTAIFVKNYGTRLVINMTSTVTIE